LSLVKSWKDNAEFAQAALALIENNGIDLKSFSRGTFPNHLASIRTENTILKTKPFTSLMILLLINGQRPSCNRKYNSRVDSDFGIVYKNFEKRDFYNAFLRNITPLSLEYGE
jgi:hypothetical protein